MIKLDWYPDYNSTNIQSFSNNPYLFYIFIDNRTVSENGTIYCNPH